MIVTWNTGNEMIWSFQIFTKGVMIPVFSPPFSRLFGSIWGILRISLEFLQEEEYPTNQWFDITILDSQPRAPWDWHQEH